VSESIMSVGRLIEKLKKFPSDMPIIGIYDWDFVEKAQKKHKKVKTVTVQDVIAIKADRSHKENAVVIKTTEVLEFSEPGIKLKK
jgi:hypothetical protein